VEEESASKFETPTGPTSIMKVHMILVGAIFLLFGVALSIFLSLARVQPLIEKPVKLVQGVSVFAVAYLNAQFIEGIVEPFNMLGGDSDRSNVGKADGSDRSSGSGRDLCGTLVWTFGLEPLPHASWLKP
jgi:hypothetical protein